MPTRHNSSIAVYNSRVRAATKSKKKDKREQKGGAIEPRSDFLGLLSFLRRALMDSRVSLKVLRRRGERAREGVTRRGSAKIDDERRSDEKEESSLKQVLLGWKILFPGVRNGYGLC